MIREYHESDVEAVARVFTDSVHGLATSQYDAEQRAAWAPQPPDLTKWKERLAALQTLVAEVDGQVAGFISYTRNGYIDLLYTSPAHARRGIASALYREAETRLVADGAAELFTEASLVARPFFERVGFQIIEEQRVQRAGVEFRRFAMRKRLVASGGRAGT